ncbi:MAG: hypothetical protein AAF518_14515 [Spirochaetota bacterium]
MGNEVKPMVYNPATGDEEVLQNGDTISGIPTAIPTVKIFQTTIGASEASFVFGHGIADAYNGFRVVDVVFIGNVSNIPVLGDARRINKNPNVTMYGGQLGIAVAYFDYDDLRISGSLNSVVPAYGTYNFAVHYF